MALRYECSSTGLHEIVSPKGDVKRNMGKCEEGVPQECVVPLWRKKGAGLFWEAL